MSRSLSLFAALSLTVASAVAFAQSHEMKVGDLTLVHPWARATAPGAPVSGGYMKIANAGSGPDYLVGGSADFAEKVEIHEMTMDGDVMKMRPVEGGLEIPAGGELELKPSGYHVMFIGMKKQLLPGTMEHAQLVFKNAGPVEVEFSVEEMKMDMKMQKHMQQMQGGQQN